MLWGFINLFGGEEVFGFFNCIVRFFYVEGIRSIYYPKAELGERVIIAA